MGRWLWDVLNVKNELIRLLFIIIIIIIRVETGCSSFEERGAKVIASWFLRIVFSENIMSDLGRACLLEIGCKSEWCARCRHNYM